VTGFIEAVAAGWKDAIADPAAAITSLIARNPAADAGIEGERLQMAIDANVLTPYVKANGFGGIDAARMDAAIEQTKSVYEFKAEPKAATFFDGSYLPATGMMLE
jgi:NitT/TauT family transport system substrate-binding protein